MSNSLRDKLLELGFKAPEKPARPAQGSKPANNQGGKPAGKPGRPERSGRGKPGARPGNEGRHGKPDRDRPAAARAQRSQEEIDLAKAYALRARKEKLEREAAERESQERARLRREAKAKLAELLEGKALNDPAAEIARHFSYGSKIKRIYVSAEQLKALNAGQLGVVQQKGRYLLVTAGVLAEAEAIFPDAIALKVDPNAPAEDDPYADPRYQVPDDLVW